MPSRVTFAPIHSGFTSGKSSASAMSASSASDRIESWRSLRISVPRRYQGSRLPERLVCPEWRSPGMPSKVSGRVSAAWLTNVSPSAT